MIRRLAATFIIVTSVSACSSAPKRAGSGGDPAAVLAQICSPSSGWETVSGNAWLKVRNSDFSGSFPAFVKGRAAPAELVIEVANLLGGTEAIVKVTATQVELKRPRDEAPRILGEDGQWAGIPLRWAGDLFLGKFPCPKSDAPARVEWAGEDRLVVSLSSQPIEQYVYTLRDLPGVGLWPDSLHWEKATDPATVLDFVFEDRDSKSGGPAKWEIRSSRGSVRGSWRDRETRERIPAR